MSENWHSCDLQSMKLLLILPISSKYPFEINCRIHVGVSASGRWSCRNVSTKARKIIFSTDSCVKLATRNDITNISGQSCYRIRNRLFTLPSAPISSESLITTTVYARCFENRRHHSPILKSKQRKNFSLPLSLFLSLALHSAERKICGKTSCDCERVRLLPLPLLLLLRRQ